MQPLTYGWHDKQVFKINFEHLLKKTTNTKISYQTAY